jgi:mannose-6-phosphate isomerase class I
MAIALTDFECLCGFRSALEIKENWKKFPEIDVLYKINQGCFHFF